MVDEFEGKVIGGRYRVDHLLGVGGSASVYEAEDITFGRRVAIKIPHENVGAESVAAKRLVREARASGAVGHPNVCEISEIGALPNGTPFIVMERLTGETLRDRITNEGRLPFADIVDIMMQVLSGLGAAHDRGIIHRDVKPENIFLAQRMGCAALVKILDFGLVSTDRLAREALTVTGVVVGTPYYLAPEHIRGLRDVDPRLDLYACGVVLYEATSGRRPFTASNTAELFREIMAGSAPSLTDLRRDTPPDLVAIVRRAMAKSPADRYPNAGSFQKALAGIKVGPPTVISLSAFKTGERHALADDSHSIPRTAAIGDDDAPTEHRQPVDPESTRIEGKNAIATNAARKIAAVGKPMIPEHDMAKSVEIELSDEDEWEQATEWDQPTLKQPLETPRKKK